jgi:6-phosphofructokinase 1
MGYAAVMSLAEGKGNRIVATQNGSIVDIDMEEALQMTKTFQMDRYQIMEALALSKPV